MDRSFLSQPEVVAASRKFVCIRLATYENSEEAKWLESIFVGGSGQLENTTFALLSPDAKNVLARPGRSPDFAFRDAHDMAGTMQGLAAHYQARKVESAGVPWVDNLRLGINVAACEGQPLVALVCPPEQRPAWSEPLARFYWQPRVQGRAVFCFESPSTRYPAGFYLLRPQVYGQSAEVVLRLPLQEGWQEALLSNLGQAQPAARALDHVREGHRRGIHWQTRIPVTDPH